MKYKTGDIVIILEDERFGETIYLKKGELCRVGYEFHNTDEVRVQSLNPSFGTGYWVVSIDNIELAPEIFQVLS
jgi:hypothetical protein